MLVSDKVAIHRDNDFGGLLSIIWIKGLDSNDFASKSRLVEFLDGTQLDIYFVNINILVVIAVLSHGQAIRCSHIVTNLANVLLCKDFERLRFLNDSIICSYLFKDGCDLTGLPKRFAILRSEFFCFFTPNCARSCQSLSHFFEIGTVLFFLCQTVGLGHLLSKSFDLSFLLFADLLGSSS